MTVPDTTYAQVMPVKLNPLPPLALLNELFEYSEGKLIRRKTTNNRAKKGDVAGTIANGYVIVNINYKLYRVHRIIWYMHTEIDPVGYEIDHKDGNPLNNKIENLRICTRSENGHNTRLSKRNTSGYKGVYWDQNLKKWRARIKHNGKMHELGLYATAKEAGTAYVEASLQMQKSFSFYKRNI